MTLPSGTRLGPYEVTTPLGAGGMGEVYRARDTKLDRDVALKILPESFASDPDRLMRFEREAKMLAGRSLYRGETVTETIAHVITQPPDWSALPASTPAPVRRLLRRCLEKDPRNRLQSAGDARLEIDEILSGPAPEAEAPATTGIARAAATPAWRRALPWTIAGMLLVALGYQLWPRPTASVQPMRFDVRLTPGEDLSILAGTDGTIAVLSPDGETLVYLAVSGPNRQLYVRRFGQLEATPLAGTENAAGQFFSPDSASIAFFANGRLMRMSLNGGAPTPLAPAANGRGGTWGPDETIVFAANVEEGLWRVSAAGGPPARVTRSDRTSARTDGRQSFRTASMCSSFARPRAEPTTTARSKWRGSTPASERC